jgi:hypothetical protein
MTSGSILEPAEGIVKEKVVKRGEKVRAIGILIILVIHFTQVDDSQDQSCFGGFLA